MLEKRIKGMAVRILTCIEHTLSCHLDEIKDDDVFDITGEELKILRNEILNSAGDTTRFLLSSDSSNKVTVSKDIIDALYTSEVNFINNNPYFKCNSSKIRNLINSGIVYNDTYMCVGLYSVVDNLIPFLDKLKLAGVNIAKGKYMDWRNKICEIYSHGKE